MSNIISARRLHPFTFRLHSVYVNVYIHYFIFKSLSYQYVAHFKMFYKSYKTHKKYKRLHKCKRRALNIIILHVTSVHCKKVRKVLFVMLIRNFDDKV
jgi:hypothetical protein